MNEGIRSKNKLGIRTGNQYLLGLQDDREVWTNGKRIKNVTTHPSTMRCAETLASFLDKQSEIKYKEKLTYLRIVSIICVLLGVILTILNN